MNSQAEFPLPLSTLKRTWIDRQVPFVLAVKSEFTSDDLHEWLPQPMERNWWGALTARLRNCGQLVEVGRKTSTRAEANGRKVTVWRVRQ